MQELEEVRKPYAEKNTDTIQDIFKKIDIPDLSKTEAAVGMSRKWGAREAGKEVAETTIRQLHEPPNFFLLFSTIHYEDHGGFQELLNGVWDVLPKGTPLVGGTVRGFINTYGCYTRGVTALAVSSTDMDVAIGYGKNTKRNPKKAAQQCARMIKKGLQDDSYEHKFLLNIISASSIPDIPPLGRKKIISAGLAPKAMMQMFGFSQYVLQKGAGRDDEVMEEMIKQFPEYCMLGGGTIDDGPNLRNFEFYDHDILTNSIVSLGLRTHYNLDVLTTHNMKKTNIDFKITKTSKDGRIIKEINRKPATSEFLRLLNWPLDFLDDRTWFNTNFYFPLGFHLNAKTDMFAPRVIGVILGESLITTIRSKDPNGSILTIDGRGLLNTIDNNLGAYSNSPDFSLIASCTTRLETLGEKVYQSRDRVLKYFGNKPFIIFYVGGESTYSPEKGLAFMNMSFNSALFWKNK